MSNRIEHGVICRLRREVKLHLTVDKTGKICEFLL